MHIQAIEPTWLADLPTALAEAQRNRRAIVMAAAGQGYDDQDNWCPAAFHTRAVGLSDPAVSTLIATAFVPLRFSLQHYGHGADSEAIAIVRQYTEKESRCIPTGIFVLSPDQRLLARGEWNALPDQNLRLLMDVLQKHPELAPDDDPLRQHHYDLSSPMQATLAALENRWRAGERSSLIAPLEEWLEEHGMTWLHGAAMATTLLGWAHLHAGNFGIADALLEDVVRRFPQHPIRHAARYSRLSREEWAIPGNPFLQGVRPPQLGIDRAVVNPNDAARRSRLQALSQDARYFIAPSGLPLARIPAGVFTMGGQPALFARELPLREVTISKPFLMSAWPVTRGLWRQFRPHDLPAPVDPLADELPKAMISHADALAFCQYLSERDGLRYRLPTEAEWEYAARGGIEGAPHPWGFEPPDNTRGNYEHSSGVPVASYPPNSFGLFEMVGNFREWTSDIFVDDAYAKTPQRVTDPHVTESDDATLDPFGNPLYVMRSGVAGLPYCVSMMRCALRMAGPDASLRLVVSLDD